MGDGQDHTHTEELPEAVAVMDPLTALLREFGAVAVRLRSCSGRHCCCAGRTAVLAL